MNYSEYSIIAYISPTPVGNVILCLFDNSTCKVFNDTVVSYNLQPSVNKMTPLVR